MFRIKTDIRQFNCETQEKVEKLIRSWVIRPTDLLLDESQQTWSPIGEHDTFAVVFDELREISDVEVEPSLRSASTPEELDDMEEELERLEKEVSTTAPNHQQPGEQGALKLRALVDKEETSSSGPLPIPVAPEGVEEAVASDEPTIMTERTADLLGVLDDGSADAEQPLPIPVAPEGVEGVAESDEATQIFERDDEDEEAPEDEPVVDADSDEEEDDDDAPRMGRHDLPEELFLTNELTRNELVSPLEPLRDDLKDADSSAEQDDETEAWEEVTRQIESPFEEEQDDDSDSKEKEDDIPLPTEGLDGVSIALSEAAESDIHSEWESMMELDELRETDEFDLSEHVVSAPDEKAPNRDLPKPFTKNNDSTEDIAFDDTQDFQVEEIFGTPSSAPPSIEEASSTSEVDEDDDLDADSVPNSLEETSVPTTEEVPENLYQDNLTHNENDSEDDSDDDDVSEVDDELIEGEETQEHDEDIESGEPFFQDTDFVSEGYAIDLPFAIGPSKDDISKGVQRSSSSEEEKDINFPRPQPKKPQELIKRRYGYGDAPSPRHAASRKGKVTSSSHSREHTDPKDYSHRVALVALVMFILVIATLIILFK